MDHQWRGLAQPHHGLAEDAFGLGRPAGRVGRGARVEPERHAVKLFGPEILQGGLGPGDRLHGVVAAAGQQIEHAQIGLCRHVGVGLGRALALGFQLPNRCGQVGLPILGRAGVVRCLDHAARGLRRRTGRGSARCRGFQRRRGNRQRRSCGRRRIAASEVVCGRGIRRNGRGDVVAGPPVRGDVSSDGAGAGGAARAAAGSDARFAAGLFPLFDLLSIGRRGADLLQEDRPEVGIRLLEVRDEFLLGRTIQGSQLLEFGHDLLHCLGIGLRLAGRWQRLRGGWRGRRRRGAWLRCGKGRAPTRSRSARPARSPSWPLQTHAAAVTARVASAQISPTKRFQKRGGMIPERVERCKTGSPRDLRGQCHLLG